MIEKKYPTKPNEEGFYFESAEDAAVGIETKQYENGNLIKKTTLSNGKVAVVRELLGKDNKDIFKLIGDDKENYLNASLAIAVKLNDASILMEDIDYLKLKDVNKLSTMHQALNF